MKLLKFILIITVVSGALFSFKPKPSKQKLDGYSTIVGTVNLPVNTQLTLSKVEHGTEFVVGTSKLNENNEFGFAVKTIKEGFYILGNKYVEIPLYVKNNQSFKIKLDVNGYQLLESPDKENDILYDFYKKTDTLKAFKYYSKPITTFEQFFPFYEKFIPEMKKFHKNVKSSNKRFNKLMNAYIDLKIEDEALNFIFTPRTKHPKAADFPSFYNDFMQKSIVESEIILDLPRGMKTLYAHQTYKVTHTKDKKSKIDYSTDMFSGIESGLLKGHLTLMFLRFKTYNQKYIDFIEPKRKYIALSDYVTEKVNKYELSIKKAETGTDGYPFTYKDVNGKDVSFKDFKGKVVYIDLWATWCAPCKVQIPFLKKLEKDLEGKPIEFVSISLDKPKNKNKWEKFVKDNKLTGTQLISENAFDTKIAKDYKVNSIPRFLLFDKNGKIVDANAKRPSSPELKKQLLELINK